MVKSSTLLQRAPCCSMRSGNRTRRFGLAAYANSALTSNVNILDRSTICLDIPRSLEPKLSTTIITLLLCKARHQTRIQHGTAQHSTPQPIDPAHGPNSAGKKSRFRPSPQGKASSPTQPSLLKPHHHDPLINQYNPCRGSSIGRACGSYNSKEINLKVVGSSPTFGYSYHIKAHPEQLFFLGFFGVVVGGCILRAGMGGDGAWLRRWAVWFLTCLLGILALGPSMASTTYSLRDCRIDVPGYSTFMTRCNASHWKALIQLVA
jgi:hypothetical protein